MRRPVSAYTQSCPELKVSTVTVCGGRGKTNTGSTTTHSQHLLCVWPNCCHRWLDADIICSGIFPVNWVAIRLKKENLCKGSQLISPLIYNWWLCIFHFFLTNKCHLVTSHIEILHIYRSHEYLLKNIVPATVFAPYNRSDLWLWSSWFHNIPDFWFWTTSDVYKTSAPFVAWSVPRMSVFQALTPDNWVIHPLIRSHTSGADRVSGYVSGSHMAQPTGVFLILIGYCWSSAPQEEKYASYCHPCQPSHQSDAAKVTGILPRKKCLLLLNQ